MLRVAEGTPGEGTDLWERLRSEATAISEEDRAMCRRIGEHGLTILADGAKRSEEHTSELQSRLHLVCRLLLEKKKPCASCATTPSSSRPRMAERPARSGPCSTSRSGSWPRTAAGLSRTTTRLARFVTAARSGR